MNGRRVGRVLLTATAGIGVAAVVLALLGVFLGVKPLLFRSGSMSPAIPAGALAFARPVDAGSIHPGDVVSVINSAGTRVTHRVVATEPQAGGPTLLTLRGDANPVADSEKYPVQKADRVFFSVPWLGYVVAFLNAPLGIFLMGGFAVLVLIYAFRRNGRRGGRHRRAASSLAVATLAAGAIVSGGTTGTMAAFTDNGTITSGPVAAGTLSPPTGMSCSGAGLLVSPTISWTAPTTGVLTNNYLVTYRSGSATAAPTTAQVTGTSWPMPASILNLLTTYYISVQTAVPGSSWVSTFDTTGYRVSVTGLIGISALTACLGTYTVTP